jgi:lysozyme
MTALGMLDIVVDVSHNNGNIDWGKVYSSGIRLAFVKATQGNDFADPNFSRNESEALEAGIDVIPYHFVTSAPFQDQCENFFRHADAPIMCLDWEGRQHSTLSAQDMQSFGAEIVARGSHVLGYWPEVGAAPMPATSMMLNWDRWTPRYPKPSAVSFADIRAAGLTAAAPPSSLFWQYTARGKILGIEGNVDRSVALFGDEAAMSSWIESKGD